MTELDELTAAVASLHRDGVILLPDLTDRELAERLQGILDTPPCPVCGSAEPDCEPGCDAMPLRGFGGKTITELTAEAGYDPSQLRPPWPSGQHIRARALFGQRVRVSLDGKGTVATGILLGVSQHGDFEILEGDRIHYCWPMLTIEAL